MLLYLLVVCKVPLRYMSVLRCGKRWLSAFRLWEEQVEPKKYCVSK